MDISQIYMASPDWIKGLMVALPFLTFYATARLFARQIPPARIREPGSAAPKTISPTRTAVPLLEQGATVAEVDRNRLTQIADRMG